jgi:hypothetical protein
MRACPTGSLEARLNVEGVELAREICKKLDVERRDALSAITEGEIVEAIHRPIVPRSLDAIKAVTSYSTS